MQNSTNIVKIMVAVIIAVIVVLASIRLLYTSGQYARIFPINSAAAQFIKNANESFEEKLEAAKEIKDKYKDIYFD
ncbi:MAG: hypothetical protein K6C14_05780 [Eubacterium sp.]|nr:hypothetical protein [Eubacterium sp.]